MEYASLTLPKSTLKNIYKALVTEHILDEFIRREHGLEDVDYPENLATLEQMLGLSHQEIRDIHQKVEDELWEYTWYAYTDEWAWFRAKKDVLKSLGAKAKTMKHDELERLVDERYRKEFEAYVGEIDMHEEALTRKKTSKKRAS